MSNAISSENMNKFVPIYKVMFEQKLIEKLMFTLCLGTNGGYFQLGGFDGTGFLEKEPAWIPILNKNSDFVVRLNSVYMNNHLMKGSEGNRYTMMIDSGTTFTYLPRNLWQIIQ